MGVKCIEATNQDGSHHSWLWHCPGCDAPHQCDARWTFNGDREKPTFRNSVLVHEYKDDDDRVIQPLCHSFVTDGRIQFLNDCGHALKGQTVDLPDWDDAHPNKFHAGYNIHDPQK